MTIEIPSVYLGIGPSRNDAVDKKVARAFLPGPPLEKHGVIERIEVVLTPQDDFCPPRQECPGYLWASASELDALDTLVNAVGRLAALPCGEAHRTGCFQIKLCVLFPCPSVAFRGEKTVTTARREPRPPEGDLAKTENCKLKTDGRQRKAGHSRGTTTFG